MNNIFPATYFGTPTLTGSTLTMPRATVAANIVLAGPASGAATLPTFRALVAADLPGGGYAEMYTYNNTVACVINTANIYHAVYSGFGNNDGVLPPIIDTDTWTYKEGTAGTITAFANYATGSSGTVLVTTSAAHNLLTGEPVTITGTSNYNAAYLVTVVATNSFYITATWVSNDGAGSVRRPATLKCLVSGTYWACFGVSGVAASANDVFKWELNRDATPLDNIAARDIWTISPNYRTVSSTGFLTMTAGQYLWLSVKNYTAANNLTIQLANVSIGRA